MAIEAGLLLSALSAVTAPTYLLLSYSKAKVAYNLPGLLNPMELSVGNEQQ